MKIRLIIAVMFFWISCAAVFSFEHAQRWPFTNRDHGGQHVQTSVLFNFHGFLGLAE